MMREQLDKAKHCVKWRTCEDKTGHKSTKETFGKSSRYVLQSPRGARGDETMIRVIYGDHQISFFAEVGPQGQR